MTAPLNPPATFALVGAGATATVLGARLRACGFTVACVVGRTLPGAETLAATLGATASTRLADARADALVLCVPDDALAAVVRDVAQSHDALDGVLVLHTSGSQPVRVLAPLAARGAYVAGFHPAQSLTRATPHAALEGACAGIEGQEPALGAARHLAERLGMVPLTIRLGSKSLYHLALVLVSNYTVTLAALATEVLESAGMDARDAGRLLHPLLAGTLVNLEKQAPGEALTGPIARGDVETVRRHLTALRATLPKLVPVYAALAAETTRLAVGARRLGADEADALLQKLQEAL